MRLVTLVTLWALMCSPVGAAPSDAEKKEVAALYESYKKYAAQKNWVLANNVGNAIVRRYPGTEAANAVAPELPNVARLADAAQKEGEAKRKQEEAKRKQDEVAAQKRAAQQKAAQKKAVATLRKQRDEVEKITFYYSPSTQRGVANQWYLYIGKPDNGSAYLRFKWMYTAENWLFIKRITVSVDGEKVGSVPIGYFAVKRDNSGGRIWEWQDESVRPHDIPFFEKLAASKKTIIRYEGDRYYDDRTLSQSEKAAFSQIVAAYRAMSAATP